MPKEIWSCALDREVVDRRKRRGTGPVYGVRDNAPCGKRYAAKAIGIEIEEKYCEIAAKRLAQEVLAL